MSQDHWSPRLLVLGSRNCWPKYRGVCRWSLDLDDECLERVALGDLLRLSQSKGVDLRNRMQCQHPFAGQIDDGGMVGRDPVFFEVAESL